MSSGPLFQGSSLEPPPPSTASAPPAAPAAAAEGTNRPSRRLNDDDNDDDVDDVDGGNEVRAPAEAAGDLVERGVQEVVVTVTTGRRLAAREEELLRCRTPRATDI